jgi:VanZ family protein
MFSNSVKALFEATRRLLRNWRTTALMATVYAALLVTIYFFVSTREATVAQLITTLLLAIAAPILFFVLQTASVNYTTQTRVSLLLRKSAMEFWKLVVVSLPLIALTIVTLYGLSKAQTHLPIGAAVAPSELTSQTQTARSQLHWGLAGLNTVRYLLVSIIVPLLLIQFWITVSNQGLGWLVTWRSLAARLREVAVRAFAPESFLIYAAGFLVFAVIPYLTLFKTMPNKRAWVEVALLAFRLLVSATLILLGWLTTVGALSISANTAESHHVEEQ